MRFSWLPWPMFVVFFCCLGLYTMYYSIKIAVKYPVILRAGFFLWGVIGVFAGVEKLAENLGVLLPWLAMIDNIVIYSTMVAVPLTIVGYYQAVKHDNIKRQKMLFLIIGYLVFLIMIELIFFFLTGKP